MKFRIIPADTFIWNLSEFVDFLIAHQNQSIIIETGTEGCCAESVGLYHWLDKFKFAKVTICTSNLLENHQVYTIRYDHPWKFVKVSTAIEPQYHKWNKKSIFGTIYGRPLWHRLGLAAHLLTQHPTISEVGLIADPTNHDSRQLFELEKLWQYHPSSFVNFANIQSQLPILHPNIDKYTPGATLTDGFVAQSKQVYCNFLIDIVAETFTTGNSFFITEKTIRPMLLKKPFIMFGSKNYLEYLRQMGFRTFGDFWNEEYDGYEGPNRFKKILELLDTLALKSRDELEKMYWDMTYTLDHNYNLLSSKSFNTEITKIHE